MHLTQQNLLCCLLSWQSSINHNTLFYRSVFVFGRVCVIYFTQYAYATANARVSDLKVDSHVAFEDVFITNNR